MSSFSTALLLTPAGWPTAIEVTYAILLCYFPPVIGGVTAMPDDLVKSCLQPVDKIFFRLYGLSGPSGYLAGQVARRSTCTFPILDDV